MPLDPRMDADPLDQLSLQGELRHAIERGELSLHYQPKVGGDRRRIRGVQALPRWQHPQRGPIAPALFVPLAERFGLAGALGQWVLQQACRQMREWIDRGVSMGVALPLSRLQLCEDDLAERIGRELERNGLDPAQLLCEVPESAAMDRAECSQRGFESLARIGVFLSVADFGQGFSSLEGLRRLAAREVKIGQGFVRQLEGSAEARAIVEAAIRLAHALGLHAVAEGVQTQGQCDVLSAFGCDELQGALFAPAMPPAELLRWALLAGTAVAASAA